MAISTETYSHIIIVLSLLSFGFLASSDTQLRSGIGTIKDPPYLPSACFDHEDKGVLIAAVSQDLWDGGSVCGKYFLVGCTGGTKQDAPNPCKTQTVAVMITDFCPPSDCKPGTFDLSHEAFFVIADPAVEEININYLMYS